jgi:DNA modification methylase
MVISAPPEIFSLSHFRPKSQRLEFPEASGEMPAKKFIGFLSRFFQNIQGAVANGAIIYVLINQKYSFHLQCAAHPTFGLAKDVSVWVKDVADPGSLYQSQHELVYIFKNGQAPHINNLGNGRNRTTIWDYSSSYTAENQQPLAMHAAARPCAMFVDAMLDCSDRGGIVLDCFGGNGVSVIAAERTGRHARVIEFYPLYVDLIVRRWQICTGNSAKHGATGHTFDTVSAEASR